jgi:ubiquinone/menaquinone biosynthesis C-methylase UbiE
MMSTVDPFGRTDRLDDAMLEALVVRFEARGRHPLFSKMLHDYLDAMGIDQAGTVLDLGCGTGLAARAIAHRSGFSGRVTGVDRSAYLIEAAQRLAREEGLADSMEFRTGNASQLDFPDEAVDAVVAHTLLSHVEEPLTILKEAARVLKPGGLIGIFDGDYTSLTFGHVDPLQGKADDEALIRAVVTNPRVMRQLPRLLPEAGLEFVIAFPYVLSEIGRADFWLSAIEAYRRLIPKSGVMTVEAADAWAANLRSDSEAGIFFGSSNYYAYVARRT